MAIHHQRQGDAEQQAGSERVIARAIDLLRLMEPTEVKKRLEKLLKATMKGEGDDVEFLNRWDYDQGQRLAIASSIYSVAEK